MTKLVTEFFSDKFILFGSQGWYARNEKWVLRQTFEIPYLKKENSVTGSFKSKSKDWGGFCIKLNALKIMPKFGLYLIYMKSVIQYRYIYKIECILLFSFLKTYAYIFLVTAFPVKSKYL